MAVSEVTLVSYFINELFGAQHHNTSYEHKKTFLSTA